MTSIFACNPEKKNNIGSCEQLQEGEELSFGAAYCQGDFCRTYDDSGGHQKHVTNEQQCEAIDVDIQGNFEEWGQDGGRVKGRRQAERCRSDRQ